MIYLDYAATTPIDQRVIAEMTRVMASIYGNPSSLHHAGMEAQRYVQTCRKEIAKLLGVKSTEIFFTSGGTEANNWALKGVMEASPVGARLITTLIEHSSVGQTARYLTTKGYSLDYVHVDSQGLVDLSHLTSLLQTPTRLVSIIGGNNEIGTIQPLQAIATLCHQHGALFHIDAVQLIGQVPFSIREIGADLVSFTAHKLYGPKGVGVLYIKEGTPIQSLLHGGHQEGGLRAGTESPFLIGGLTTALRIALQEQLPLGPTLREFTTELQQSVLSSLPTARWNGPTIGEQRLPGNLSFSFTGLDGQELVFQLQAQGFAVSTGSACHADEIVPSHVIQAIQVPTNSQLGTLRITLGRHTTCDEITLFAQHLIDIVKTYTS